MKIDLPLMFPDGALVVEATLVDVAPHLPDWTFASHRSRTRAEWGVSNVETGYCIPQAWHTRRATSIQRAREFLATITPEQIAKQAEKCARVNFTKHITPLD